MATNLPTTNRRGANRGGDAEELAVAVSFEMKKIEKANETNKDEMQWENEEEVSERHIKQGQNRQL